MNVPAAEVIVVKKMTYVDAAKRALATVVFAATGSLIGSAAFGIAAWKAAASAALGGLVNYAYRAAQAYLESKKEG